VLVLVMVMVMVRVLVLAVFDATRVERLSPSQMSDKDWQRTARECEQQARRGGGEGEIMQRRRPVDGVRVSPAHGHQGFRWGFQGSNGGYYRTPTLHIRGPASYARGPIWTPGPQQGKPWAYLILVLHFIF
jgi:hypothetical protein